MFLSTIRLLPLPDQRLEVLELLRSVQGPTLAHEGCLGCRIYEEEGATPTILFCERWDTEVHLEAHIRSDLYRRVLAALELSSEAPDIGFHRVASSEGLAFIERLRGPREVSGWTDPKPQHSV